MGYLFLVVRDDLHKKFDKSRRPTPQKAIKITAILVDELLQSRVTNTQYMVQYRDFEKELDR